MFISSFGCCWSLALSALVCLRLGDAVAFAEVGLPKGTDSALHFGSFIQRLYLIVACRPLITGVTDYGVTMDAILSGKEKVPLQGTRFDVAFEGRAKGRLAGKVRGVDYLLMRAVDALTSMLGAR